MFTQCDQHRRDRDAVVADQHIAAAKQHKRNAIEWARRAAEALIHGDTKVAAAQFAKAVEEMEAAL
jgi:hypothetical protein